MYTKIFYLLLGAYKHIDDLKATRHGLKAKFDFMGPLKLGISQYFVKCNEMKCLT